MDKAQWWMVTKTKAKSRIEVECALEVAFQNNLVTFVQRIVDTELIEILHDDGQSSSNFKEVGIDKDQEDKKVSRKMIMKQPHLQIMIMNHVIMAMLIDYVILHYDDVNIVVSCYQ